MEIARRDDARAMDYASVMEKFHQGCTAGCYLSQTCIRDIKPREILGIWSVRDATSVAPWIHGIPAPPDPVGLKWPCCGHEPVLPVITTLSHCGSHRGEGKEPGTAADASRRVSLYLAQ
ncbi:hypothetical protein RALTA_A0254 [Cupriavidus taiwanensis LMG 19424]|uniref:Uncharacterized protein n=1 Tax=Cupriavidus taiwanensis (strain DSM 17343 / BCRC 17206 / CCUG 44338 / CIP 107171 / LMG 19424 / R1) TaxID=977880 RepID=B2AGM5_CUPTR|nr:hypothetical protein RALTA_A0254 [Cupriavidus taiwanensis LMG 19424]